MDPPEFAKRSHYVIALVIIIGGSRDRDRERDTQSAYTTEQVTLRQLNSLFVVVCFIQSCYGVRNCTRPVQGTLCGWLYCPSATPSTAHWCGQSLMQSSLNARVGWSPNDCTDTHTMCWKGTCKQHSLKGARGIRAAALTADGCLDQACPYWVCTGGVCCSKMAGLLGKRLSS